MIILSKKHFTKSVSLILILSFCVFIFHPSSAQIFYQKALQQTRFSFSLTSQPSHTITSDSLNRTFSSKSFCAGFYIPVYAKKIEKTEQGLSNFFCAFITPNIKLTNINIGYLYDSRVLINGRIGFGALYQFKQKNTLAATTNLQLNEDELTTNNPVINYAGLFLYTRRCSSKFSYYVGAAYTYLFGYYGNNGLLLPILGARFNFHNKSFLTITLPYNINYLHIINNKLMYSVAMYPYGGINRYRNRSYSTNYNDAIMFRSSSLVLGSTLYFRLKNNLTLGTEVGIVGGQKFMFTNDKNSITYQKDEVKNGLLFSVKFIWRPMQNSLRAKEKLIHISDEESIPDLNDDSLLGF
ncbi:MAG: DUF6268 family outer membrane beta-barrel protein [Bacteroidota bacterium]